MHIPPLRLRPYVSPVAILIFLFCLDWSHAAIAQCVSDNSNTHVSSNQTWNTRHDIPGLLTVDSNVTLIIRDTVTFTDLGRLHIKRGGRVKLYGGVLTRSCSGQMWVGIEMYGTKTRDQISSGAYDPGQSVFISDSGSVVSWAMLGAHVPDGAIIRAKNTTFLNCRKTIQFWPYFDPSDSSTNESQFIDCDFLCNDTLPGYGGRTLNAFITLWEVRGIVLQGNNFINSTAPSKITASDTTYDGLVPYVTKFRGIGIGSVNSSFTLTKSGPYSQGTECPVPLGRRNVLKNLTKGVEFINQDFFSTRVTIQESDFINIGFYSFFGKEDIGTVIRKCLFKTDVDFITSSAQIINQAFVTFRESKGLILDSNKFIRGDTFPSYIRLVTIFSSGRLGAQVYSNYFEHTSTSTDPFSSTSCMVVYGNNPKLIFQCNSFNVDALRDVYFVKINTNPVYPIFKVCDQGSSNMDAGNLFSPTNGGMDNQSVKSFQYYYNTSGSSRKNPNVSTTTGMEITKVPLTNTPNPCTSTTCY